MENHQGLNDSAGNTAKLFTPDYNNSVTGERKTSSLESSLPPLPEPTAMSRGFSAGSGVHAPQEPLREDSHQTYDTRQDAVFPGSPRALQEGCYYIRMMPTSLHTPARFQYEGTLRIQRTGGSMIASGDLYINDFCKTPTYCPVLSENDQRKNIIPVFSRKRYAYYLRVTHIHGDPDTGKGIVLELEPFRFQHANHTWIKGEPLTAEVKFSIGPDGIHYWRGDVQTQSNIVLGHMVVVWVSPFLRQAVIEIDRVAASECPSEDMECKEWQAIFKKAGWDVTMEISDENVEEPEDFSWSTSELHQKMMKYRQNGDLDKEWRYHLLAIRQLDDKEAFGLMYDNTISGINDIPREGAAIASHVMFPGKDFWGKCKGNRFGASKGPYIRTAIHEIGHAMMLYHPDNVYENYIMQKTVNIANNAYNAVPPQQFPDNIEWSFSPRDIRLLCHLPDIAVRPGGVSFGTPHHRLPVNVRDEVVEADGLEMEVSALNEVVPMGAPVRVNFSLINRSDREQLVPGSLSMKTGHISGRVIDPLGAAQDFATIHQYTMDIMPQTLSPGESINHSVTLLWGTEGPLFPTSGYYRIIIEINWYLEGLRMRIAGSTSVMITSPTDDEHARAALKVLSTPDTLLSLAIGGDHFEVGNEIIRAAISHPVLRHHYSLIEAKRVGQRYFNRKPNLKEAADIVNEETVMSPAEVKRLAKILRNFANETDKDVVEKMSKVLLDKAKGTTVEDMVEPMIKEIQEQFVQ
ncbi:MAG: hypothetical protein JSV88_20330 [Candidatus Aminicenantes bacterium]|nr:MAG: hypothetical protein JSV88_20330 [Candidatus Aminicenantes bacterium]